MKLVELLVTATSPCSPLLSLWENGRLVEVEEEEEVLTVKLAAWSFSSDLWLVSVQSLYSKFRSGGGTELAARAFWPACSTFSW